MSVAKAKSSRTYRVRVCGLPPAGLAPAQRIISKGIFATVQCATEEWEDLGTQNVSNMSFLVYKTANSADLTTLCVFIMY